MEYLWCKIRRKMVKGVIFDMDGVLVDNKEAHIEAFVKFCARYGVDIRGVDLSWMYGKGNDEIIPRLMPEVAATHDMKELSDEKEAVYREVYAQSMSPVEGLTELLADLRRGGVKCAVGSSAPAENVDFVLDGLGIRDYFGVIVHGDMVARAKPDPAIYLLCLEKLGLPASRCMVMEDSFAGIESARRAGIRVIGLATTNSAEALEKADVRLIVPDFKTLTYDILENL